MKADKVMRTELLALLQSSNAQMSFDESLENAGVSWCQKADSDQVKSSVNVGSVGHRLPIATQRVRVWTRRSGEIPQPSDEYALHAVLPYTAPSHT